MFSFAINHTDANSKARTGLIKTKHGELHTPAFIPVATKAAIKGLSPKQLEEIGFEAALCNTYHLYLKPGEKTVAKLGGLQKFMGWNKPLFTDSGGFQVFSLNDGMCDVNDDHVLFKSYIDQSIHEFTPEKSIQIQRDLGADIIFAFDECLHFTANEPTVKESLQRTHAWAKRSLEEFQKNKGHQALYGIVQGGRYEKLREESAKFISSLDFDGIGIGSIFGRPKVDSVKIMQHTMKFLPVEKAKHFLGIGAVEDLFYYVEMGVDTFDCVLPTRLARVGYIFIRPESGGKLGNKFRYRLTNSKFKEDEKPLDENCSCYVCTTFSRAYIHHLFKAKELLAYTLATYHNLHFFFQLMKEMRQAIEEDKFVEMKKEWLDE